jgi:hypothetical protein
MKNQRASLRDLFRRRRAPHALPDQKRPGASRTPHERWTDRGEAGGPASDHGRHITLLHRTGSYWGLVPFACHRRRREGVLFVDQEDEEQLLRETLPGYREYQQKVRHRLLPGIW